MGDTTKINMLLDFYGALLSEKQRQIVEMYYSMDMTLAEIAEDQEISRQAAHDSLTRGVAALEDYDKALGLIEKSIKANDLISEIQKYVGDNEKAKETLKKLETLL